MAVKAKRREQPYLKGRNMTVGQLVYKMRANQLSLEQAASDMDLPKKQVMEAVAYYQIHRDLIESEMEEEKQYLVSQGVELEPRIVDDCAFSHELRRLLLKAGHDVETPADVHPPLTGEDDAAHLEPERLQGTARP